MAADLPLIGLAHGSRHAGVTSSIRSLMLAARRLGSIPTAYAYLDLTDPDLTTAALDLAEQGFQQGVVAPLLFTSAFHATVDVPQAVAAASERSGLQLRIADIVGTGDDVLDLLQQSLRLAGIPDDTSVLLFSVGSSDDAANDAVRDLAVRLAVTRSGAVEAAFGTRPPRSKEVLARLDRPTAILPLFVSPGLLLDPLLRLAADQGMVVAPPLGDLVAPLLLQRYDASALHA
ncbi:MAG TPA: CbiX/SirB N-terminal domain-containing protein [Propionibacteriaceae bacterium]|nr:CbiX/SirB N-terminal domain-containing protein [Propionibacteriaceae bacterium]